MIFYLSSPGSQLHASILTDESVLISFASKCPWLERWMPSFGSLMLDSGAYSELTGKAKIDIYKYVEWVKKFPWADSWAGLDDIHGDWKRSMRNYAFGGFPTYHEPDPPELLDELIPMARERAVRGKSWLGLGMIPPRTQNRPIREQWLRETLERIPSDIHIHGWALGAYMQPEFKRIDSMDSTHWWREAMKYRRDFPWLTYKETLRIAVLKVKRLQHTGGEVSGWPEETEK